MYTAVVRESERASDKNYDNLTWFARVTATVVRESVADGSSRVMTDPVSSVLLLWPVSLAVPVRSSMSSYARVRVPSCRVVSAVVGGAGVALGAVVRLPRVRGPAAALRKAGSRVLILSTARHARRRATENLRSLGSEHA